MRRKVWLLVSTLAVLWLADRVVFHSFIRAGAIWRADPVLGYVHRPGVVSSWGGEYDDKPIQINSHGYHDDEFPEAKAAGELRGLFIGDSIVMGHGVEATETFPNQLENLLARESSDRSYQLINAGVQGYSTPQYVEAFRRAIRFSPDFVVVGFCMNDVTEPLVLTDSGGRPIPDYHLSVRGTSESVDFLLNDTGVGRLASWIRQYLSRDELVERWSVYGVDKMIEGKVRASEMEAAWKTVLDDLDRMYALARENDVPIVLVIFPEVIQLERPSLQEPQRKLKGHAASRGVAVLDVTEAVARFLASGGSAGEIFLDSNHYTARGHELIAGELRDLLRETGIVPAGN